MKYIGSASGGESSVFMAIKMKERFGDDVGLVFANTSMERKESYEFIKRVDEDYNLGIVYLEAVIHQKKGVGFTAVKL